MYKDGVDIEHLMVPPENTLGNQYERKWTIFRSPRHRVIVVSDDPDDERTEMTGKKRIKLPPATGDDIEKPVKQAKILRDSRSQVITRKLNEKLD